MSRIAIIDTAIDATYIGGKSVEHINLCGEVSDCVNMESHGTLCAMTLNHCTSDYELVNIQMFTENKSKVFGKIELLAKALQLCCELNVDIISLSAVSSILTDTKFLYNITCEIARDIVIISALDNMRYITVPTSYPHVLGVSSDIAELLLPGELAYSVEDSFGVNIYANCDFPFLREARHGPSNSFAVPVVAAYINKLINSGHSRQDIDYILRNQKPYHIHKRHKQLYTLMRPMNLEIPVVLMTGGTAEMCIEFMDTLFEKYEIQSSVVSLIRCPYDIRVKRISDANTVQENLHFMKNYYKTDIIFIIGTESLSDEVQRVVDIDVRLIPYSREETWIKYESGQKLEMNLNVPDVLYRILTT